MFFQVTCWFFFRHLKIVAWRLVQIMIIMILLAGHWVVYGLLHPLAVYNLYRMSTYHHMSTIATLLKIVNIVIIIYVKEHIFVMVQSFLFF